MLLLDAGQEARHIDERDQRNVEAVAESDEARRLVRGVDVQHAGQHLGLLRDDPDASSLDAGESADDVPREMLMHLGERLGVDDSGDDATHVVGALRRIGYERVEVRAACAAAAIPRPWAARRCCSAACS